MWLVINEHSPPLHPCSTPPEGLKCRHRLLQMKLTPRLGLQRPVPVHKEGLGWERRTWPFGPYSTIAIFLHIPDKRPFRRQPRVFHQDGPPEGPFCFVCPNR